MELQTTAIITIIIITILMVIGYGLYIMYNQNKDLQKKVTGLTGNLTSLESNFNALSTIFNSVVAGGEDPEQEEDEDPEQEDGSELGSDLESEIDSETQHIHSKGSRNAHNNKLSFETFSQSAEELNNLQKLQKKVEGGKITEIDSESDSDSESGSDADSESENEPEPVSIVIGEIKKCPAKLKNGKRKGETCCRKTEKNSEYCKLHLE